MSWIPQLRDEDEINNSGGLLLTKAKTLCIERLNKPILNVIKDDHGAIAWKTNEFYLVAKSYVYGYIVSCHKELVDMALENGFDIVMYIEKSDKFYRFNPKEIIEKHTINQRAGIDMINFDIKLGTNMENIPHNMKENN